MVRVQPSSGSAQPGRSCVACAAWLQHEARQAIEAALVAPGLQHANGFDAVRQAPVWLRERDRIADEVLACMLRETDLTACAAEGDTLPGMGQPNP